jgi:hypothetical protein
MEKLVGTTKFWYNSSFHSALGRSPFEAIYGWQPRTLGIEPAPASRGKLDDWLSERAAADMLIRQHLTRAMNHVKNQAYKNRSESEFSVGTWVYMKLQPCVQSSVMCRANQKLGFMYFGPFRISARVGSVAYRLELPDTASIHPVAHVSQLRLAAGFQGKVCAQLPSDALQFRVPLQVLGTRTVVRDTTQVTQVRVKWSTLPDELTTWEDYEALKPMFPHAPRRFSRAGNVSTGSDVGGSKTATRETDAQMLHRSVRPRKPSAMYSGPVTCGV